MQNNNPGFVSGGDTPSGILRQLWQKARAVFWPVGASPIYKAAVLAITCTVLFGGIFIALRLAKSDPPLKTGTSQNQPEQETAGEQPNTGETGDEKPDTPTEKKKEAAKNDGKKPGGATSSGGSGTGSSGGGSSPGGSSGSGNGGGTSTGTCPAFPAFPNASCTGWQHTGVTLRDCDTTLSDNNATYDGCLFDGGVVVVGTNITIKRSKITGIVDANWDANDSLRGLTLIDVEIDGSPYPDPFGQAAIGLDNYTCIRCHVHNTGRGANFRNNVRIEDSYFHSFAYTSGAHQSGVGSNGGSGNIIRHNNIVCNGVGGSGCSGAFVMYGDFDPVDDILVEYNLFNTDGSYCTYAGSTGASSGKAYPHGTNIRYLNNRFGKTYYSTCGDNGPVAAWENNSGNVWSGNAWADGSGAVNP